MFWDKKGLSWQGVLVGLLLTLIVGGVLIWFVGGPYKEWALSLGGGGERMICRKSVELNARRINIAGIKSNPFVDIKCKEIPVEVNEEDPEKIKKILADRLYWTWEDFGKGTIELFERGWFLGGTYCKKRYSPIKFKDKVEVNNFVEYLAKEKPAGKETSYWEFITGSRLEGDVSELGKISDKIDTNKEYVILFMTHKFGFWEKWVVGTITGLGGGILGYVVGYGVGGLVALLPIPGARIAAVGIIAATTAAGIGSGALSGFVVGTAFEDFTSEVALVPFEQVAEFGCEA